MQITVPAAASRHKFHIDPGLLPFYTKTMEICTVYIWSEASTHPNTPQMHVELDRR